MILSSMLTLVEMVQLNFGDATRRTSFSRVGKMLASLDSLGRVIMAIATINKSLKVKISKQFKQL